MPDAPLSQTVLRIGVDVGGTFTDCVAWDGRELRTAKLPSTPPDYERAVIEAIRRVAGDGAARVIHGSTVATNALLQRRGEPVAFITTEGFRDMLLIGRQNRPSLYALHVRRHPPITPEENWFTLRERVGAQGQVVTPLADAEVQGLSATLKSRGLRHVAVCLLFSFVNPMHERRVGELLRGEGFEVTLSSDLIPEFREYERASTTAINASLRPTVKTYLAALQTGIGGHRHVEIIHSSGGTMTILEASEQAARLVLSGPAGGVLGAALVARVAGLRDIITYDMGGTSTDVATILDGRPQWTTSTTVDGLPLALPMFDIHTVGAGGGSVAHLDAGGALRVGPRSAGAAPGPACYGRGGVEPTVTDANLVLGRLLPDAFLGGAMKLRPELAEQTVGALGRRMSKTMIESALGIVQIAEANMAAAVRQVTSRRGHDPRDFALVSFGGAGGLHVAAIAESLDIRSVLVPPHCGLLSALGMVTAPAVHDASRTVVHLDPTDATLSAAYTDLFRLLPSLPDATDERFADLRFAGQSHEVKISVGGDHPPTLAHLRSAFLDAYDRLYGSHPDRPIQVVTLRVRRTLPAPRFDLPHGTPSLLAESSTTLIDPAGQSIEVPILRRSHLSGSPRPGPFLLIDADATTFVPAAWAATSDSRGIVRLVGRA